MNPKNISLLINCLCLGSNFFPLLRTFSKEHEWTWNTIYSTGFVILLINGSAIINLILATRTKTQLACIINSIAALGFTAWFWYVHTGLAGETDAQTPIVYAFITPKSLVVMIPLWIAWTFFNNPEKAKNMV